MTKLSGKVAVITGAASGMGLASAILFARMGANVVLADLNVAGGEEAAQCASAEGAECEFLRTDVAEEEHIEKLVAVAVDKFGGLDIMFNNAGLEGAVGPIERISVADWDRTQNVCLRGVFLGIKHSTAPMHARGGGSIISTSSIAGVSSVANHHAYCAAKAGVVNLTRSAAVELARYRIRVNCIAPGSILTPIIHVPTLADPAAIEASMIASQPWPEIGLPEDIANTALFLASPESRFITGHTIVVDGGATASPYPNVFPLMEGDSSTPKTYIGPSFE